MKVISINAVSVIKSTGRIVNDISLYLNGIDHTCYIAYSAGPKPLNGYLIGGKLEKKKHAFYSRFFGKQGYFSNNSTIKLLEYIGNANPDIVHLHNLHANYINIRLLLNFLAKNDIATVITLHDCWFFTGKCTHFTSIGCYKWKDECGLCPQLKKDNASWFFDCTEKMLKDKKELFGNIRRLAVIGVSRWMTNNAGVSILSDAAIIKGIYNWVDTDIFKPINSLILRQTHNIVGKFVILGVASVWSASKGLDRFIELSKEVDKSMVIILIGMIKHEKKLPSNIIHFPETNDVVELVKYYSIADVFLNLSIEESFGNVTLEAMACGTPVIVFDSTANPELVGHRCGHVCKTFCNSELLGLISKVKLNTKSYYSDSCIDFVKRHFNIADRIKDYVDVYEELIALKEN